MLGRIIFILSVVLLCSCSAEKRLSRLIAKNPKLMETDTIFFRDTIVVPGVNHDTIFSLQTILHSKDTITIVKDRLTQKIFYNRDSIFISGQCQTDTIYKDNYRAIERYSTTKNNWLGFLICFGFGFVIALFLYQYFSRKH